MKYKIHQLTQHDGRLTKSIPSKIFFSNNSTAIIVHIFYLDVWYEIVHYLETLNLEFDLYITLSETIVDTHIVDIMQQFPDAYLYKVENRGRDVLPFLQILNLIDETKYDYLCKLHTKKSVEIDNGYAWRKLLYYDLIGSEEIVNNILKRFETDEQLGMVTGKNLVLNGAHFDLGNHTQLQELASLSGISFKPDYLFAAGTMFWIRTRLLSPIFSLIQNNQLRFEKESGQTDHTLAHALERYFGLLCLDAEQSIEESNANYKNLDEETLNQLAMLAFTQRFKYDREIQYRDKLIQERDKLIQEVDHEIFTILSSKSYKLTLPFRKLPFVIYTLLHFNPKKIHFPESNEFRLTQAIKRRLPKKVRSLLKRLKRKLKKSSNQNQLWHKPLTHASKNKGVMVLIIAELSIPQCTKYRVEQKVEMLKSLGYNTWVVSWTNFNEARHLLQMSALVFFYRVPAYPLVMTLIDETERLGIKSFFDVDDLIFDKSLLTQNINIKQLPRKEQKALFNGADLYQKSLCRTTYTTASTPSLAKAMQTYNLAQNYLIPNCLDKTLLAYVNQEKRQSDDTIKIVYGSGTSTHDIDFLEASDALVYILKKYAQVRLIIHGTLTLPKDFDALTSQIKHIPFMPIEEYYTHLQTYHINIAPLEKTLFNDAKSNIKFLEASIFKLPTIASNVAEYRTIINEGENGFVASNTKEWIAAFETLIQNKYQRKSVGEQAYQTVIEHYSIEKIAKKYMLPLLQEHLYLPRSKTKHILMANVLYNPISFGGATIVIEELSKRIAQKKEYDVTIFTGFFDENYDLPRPYDLVRYEINNVPVILVRFPFPMSKTLEYRNENMEKIFDQVLQSLQPDLVHFHSIQQLSASIANACRKYHIPYMITLHDMWWLCEKQFMLKPDNTYCYQKKIDTDYCITQCTHQPEATRARTSYLKPILNDAALLLAPSSFQAQMYRHNDIEENKIKINKNAVIFPSEKYKKEPYKLLRFAYLGGKATHKGYDFIKEIFESITSPNYELTVVDIHQKLGHHSIVASDWQIKGSLKLSNGYTYSQKGLDDFFANIDVLLFPSQWKESFGLTVREALVRDVWVISTDAGGVVEDIVENENGNIVSIGDLEDFKKAVEIAIDNTETLKHFINPYKSMIRAYDTQVEELLDYYSEILENK